MVFECFICGEEGKFKCSHEKDNDLYFCGSCYVSFYNETLNPTEVIPIKCICKQESRDSSLIDKYEKNLRVIYLNTKQKMSISVYEARKARKETIDVDGKIQELIAMQKQQDLLRKNLVTVSNKIKNSKTRKLFPEDHVDSLYIINELSINHCIQKIREYDLEITRLKREKRFEQKLVPCFHGNCSGYLVNKNNEYVCLACLSGFCVTCETKSHEGECDSEIVETVKVIKQTTIQCPSCFTRLEKLPNTCNVTLCLNCHTKFDYDTFERYNAKQFENGEMTKINEKIQFRCETYGMFDKNYSIGIKNNVFGLLDIVEQSKQNLYKGMDIKNRKTQNAYCNAILDQFRLILIYIYDIIIQYVNKVTKFVLNFESYIGNEDVSDIESIQAQTQTKIDCETIILQREIRFTFERYCFRKDGKLILFFENEDKAYATKTMIDKILHV